MVSLIRDRGTKWSAIMLPDHVEALKKAIIDENRIEKPKLDEQAIEEFELVICEAMEFNRTLIIEFYDNGFLNTIIGTVHYINHMDNKMIIQERNDSYRHIPFNQLVNIHQEKAS